ncbi:MAG TPA: diacylglycerol kinase family protein [Daejeonella sp.]|nr:diacylglycerol kinase family protein [Daejeonella sp.]
MRKFLLSFTYAWKGLSYAFRTQLNFKVHSFAALLALLLGYRFDISIEEWLWIILAIGIVLIAELFNTALEVLVDLVSPGYHAKAGIVKDVSAAAVLITTFLAGLIGLMVFVPKFL